MTGRSVKLDGVNGAVLIRMVSEQCDSKTVSGRLELLADELERNYRDSGELPLAEVKRLLFPDSEDKAVALRDFRRQVNNLAASSGISFNLAVDSNKNRKDDRPLWVEGADPAKESVRRHIHQIIPMEAPEFTNSSAQRPFKVTIHGDYEHERSNELIVQLVRRLELVDQFELHVTTARPLAGQDSERVLRDLIDEADVTILLISVGLYHDRALLATTLDAENTVPVQVEPAPPHADSGWIPGDTVLPHRDDSVSAQVWADEVLEHLFTRYVPDASGEVETRRQPRVTVRDVKVDLLEADRPEHVPSSARRANMANLAYAGAPVEEDVQEYLMQWARRSTSRPYLAILGEYGMGKTTACQQFVRTLEDAAVSDNGLGPVEQRQAIYVDLRKVGPVSADVPSLHELLASWLKETYNADSVTPEDVVRLVRSERAVIIFDGLDEVLVHLDHNASNRFVQRLWQILPPSLFQTTETPERLGRVVFTCRTHYFETLKAQSGFFNGQSREAVQTDMYEAILLLPFKAQQIERYLENASEVAAVGGSQKALELIREIHDLFGLAQRPVHLSMIAGQLGHIEQRRSRGEELSSASLYDILCEELLIRDDPKHRIPKQLKPRLLEDLAAELWRRQVSAVPVDELFVWLQDYLTHDAKFSVWHALEKVSLHAIDEDLRTATFLIRPGERDFGFAHTSLLEYFLARYLMRLVDEKRFDLFEMAVPSDECLDFFGQLLEADKRLERRRSLEQAAQQLGGGVAWFVFSYGLYAREHQVPGLSLTRLDLRGRDLSGLTIGDSSGSLLRRLDLQGVDLSNANLRQAVFSRVDLQGAIFVGADLSGTIFRECVVTPECCEDATEWWTQWLWCDGLPASNRGAPYALVAPQADAKVVGTVEPRTGHASWVWSVGWSPDGSMVVSGGDDGVVRVFDVGSGSLVSSLSGHTGWVRSVGWSPDGSMVVAGGQDGSVRVFDVGSGSLVSSLSDRSLSGDSGAVWSVGWSPDGSMVVAGGDDGVVRVFDVGSGSLVSSLSGHTGAVWSVGWSPDGSMVVAAGGDGVVRVFDVGSGSLVSSLSGHTGAVRSVGWSPDGSIVVSGGDDGSVRVFDVKSGQTVTSFSLLPEGETVAFQNNEVIACSPGAWQWLGIPTTLDDGTLINLPAETNGPLPVTEAAP